MAFNLGTATGRLIIDGTGAKKGFGVATVAANAFYKAVSDKADSVKRIGTNLTSIGVVGSAGLGVAVKAAASFEAELSAVKAVSGATTDEMDALRAMALRIGKDTSFSATEAASALEELVKAGVSTKDILNGAADATVSLAAAGQIDLPEAAAIASSAINNFALSGKELPHVADLIAGAANASAIDVHDFGYSLSQAGAVAHLTGLSFDDLSVAIAEMGQAGIKGSDAGTSIKTFLTNLIPTTDKQRALFEELGLSVVNTGGDFSKLGKYLKGNKKDFNSVTEALQQYVADNDGAAVGTSKNTKEASKLGSQMGVVRNAFFDANGNMEDFKTIQLNLQKATKNLTKEQKLNALQTLFGSDAIRASAVFADQGAKGFDKMSASIGKVKAADVAKTRLDNLNGSIEQFKGSLETAEIIVGTVFLPIVRKFVDGLTSLINIFNNLPEPVQKTIAVMIGLGSVFSLATGLAIKLAFVLAPMLARFLGFQALKGIFSIFVTGFKVWRSGAGVAVALSSAVGRAGLIFTRFATIGKFLFGVLVKFPRLFAVLRTAATFAFGPWGIAIAAVVIALVVLYKKFAPFKKLVDDVAGAIKNTLVRALNEVKLALHAFVGAFQEGDVTSDGFIGKVEAVGSAAHKVWGRIKELADLFKKTVIPAFKEAGKQVKDQLGQSFHELSDTFKNEIIPALQQLKTAFVRDLLPSLKKLWTQVQPLVVIMAKLAGIIVGVLFLAFLAVAKVLIGKVLPVIILLTAKWLVGMIQIMTGLTKILISVVAFFFRLYSVIVSNIIPAMKAFVSAVSGAFSDVVSAIQSAFSSVIGFITGVFAQIASVVMTGVNAVLAVWKAVWGVFGPLVKAYLTLVKLIVEVILLAVLVVVTNILNLMYNVVSSVFNSIVNTAKTIFALLSLVITTALNAILVVVQTVAGAIQLAWTAFWNGFYATVTAVWNLIGPYVIGAANGILTAIKSVFSAIATVATVQWNLFKKYIIGPVGSAVSYVKGKLNDAKVAVSAAWSAVKTTTANAFDSFKSIIKTKTSSAMSPLSGLKRKIQGFFSGARGWLAAAGRAIIQGLLDGINAMIGRVQGTLNNLTNALPDWKGPMTKDRVLLNDNGVAIMDSLINAFKSKFPEVQKTLQGLTAAIPSQVTVAQMNENTDGGNTFTRRPPGSGSGAPAAAGPSTTVNNNWNVYNPVAEKTSVTTTREATRRAALGVLA